MMISSQKVKLSLWTDGSAEDLPDKSVRVRGAHLLLDGLELVSCKRYKIPSLGEYKTTRNVAGELVSAYGGLVDAHAYAADKGLNPSDVQINMYYDYRGVAEYLTGAYKARGALAKKYKLLYDTMVLLYKYSISFYHVKAHTGVELNELCDKVAGDKCGDTITYRGVVLPVQSEVGVVRSSVEEKLPLSTNDIYMKKTGFVPNTECEASIHQPLQGTFSSAEQHIFSCISEETFQSGCRMVVGISTAVGGHAIVEILNETTDEEALTLFNRLPFDSILYFLPYVTIERA